jgi:hypothetical protein
MSRIQVCPDVSQQDQKLSRVAPNVPDGWAKVPHSIARDRTLSAQAFRLWVIFDGRQGQRPNARVGQKVLADDLGVSTRTIKRLVSELVEAGHLTVKQTSRTAIYVVHNPARDREQMSPREAMKGHGSHLRRDIDVPATEQETLRNKKASTHEIPAITVEPVIARSAATKSGIDSLTLEQFRDLLPEQIRPRPETHLANTLAVAIANGWTIQGLALALKAEIPNPQAGPGLAVKILRQLSQRPPSEYIPPSKAVRYNANVECRHGVLKIYGGCIPCNEERERAERAKVYSMAASEGQPFWEDGQL